jgi:type IX secretion system PorP/SprF family membrane protein
MLKKSVFTALMVANFIIGYGQDMHFSQATNFPLLINPAYSGIFEGQTRATFSARNQNLLIPNTAFSGVYNTIGASVDTKIFEDKTDQNTWSIGMTLLSDYAGSGTLATSQALLHTGYNLAMDRYGQSFLSFSAQAGVTNRRLFSNDLLFESQINEFEFDPRLPNLEPFIDGSSQTSFLLNIGAVYQQKLGENSMSQLGFSLYNVNQPKQLFYSNSNENIYSRLNLTGGILFKLDDVSKLYPSVVYMKQGSFHSLNMGMSYTRELSETVSVIGGLRTRLGDAFIVIAGMKYNKFQSTISYDITTSNLAKSNKTVGALELNLTYIFGESKEGYGSDKMYCPSY